MVDPQAKQLVGAALRQILLELSMLCHHFLRHAGISQQTQQQVDGFSEKTQCRCPAAQFLLPECAVLVLPRVVGRQVKTAGAARNACAAADTHQPFIFSERLACFP